SGTAPGDRAAEGVAGATAGGGCADRGGEVVGGDRGRRKAFPLMGGDLPEDLGGKPPGAGGGGAPDPGAGSGTRGPDEVFQLQGERLASLGLDLVDTEDLAEEVCLDGRWLGQVNAGQVELALAEPVGRPDEGPLLRGKVERRVALGAPEPHLAGR